MKSMNAVEEELFRWVLDENLNSLVGFHNSIRSLLREKLEAPGTNLTQPIKTAIYSQEKINTKNCFLLAFSYTEEMLYLIWKTKTPKTEPKVCSGFMERYKPIMKALKINVGTLPCWNFLAEASQVRNCIVHANGRPSLLKDRTGVDLCVSRHKKELSIVKDKIQVSPEFLQRLIAAIRELCDAMLAA